MSKGPHPYTAECQCYRCKGIRNLPAPHLRGRKPPRRWNRERAASREEQQALYLDSGPQNWDDR